MLDTPEVKAALGASPRAKAAAALKAARETVSIGAENNINDDLSFVITEEEALRLEVVNRATRRFLALEEVPVSKE